MIPHRVVLTGPESSGKTTLARQLAAHLGEPMVPEFARTYLSAWQRPYQLEDLHYLQRGQYAWEQYYSKLASNILVLDTDWTVFRIWLNHFSPESPLLLPASKWSMAFLCSPEIPWEYDPLREHPEDRGRLFEEYAQLLHQTGQPFQVLTGNKKERFQTALQAIEHLLP
jgi:nicotinamide riboside kinase